MGVDRSAPEQLHRQGGAAAHGARACRRMAATAFPGEGPIRYAGRWHHAGTPVVHCSQSRALGARWQRVRLQRDRLPRSPSDPWGRAERPPGCGEMPRNGRECSQEWLQ
jgi:hypothetical protein